MNAMQSAALKGLVGVLGLGLTTACGLPTYGPLDLMDAGQAAGLSQAQLLSQLGPPGEADRAKPVAILVHGYSASPFETSEAARHLKSRGFLVSEVALGGHQSGLSAFAQSTWVDWQAPLVAEYQALLRLGYRQPALLGTSTGGALIVEGLASQRFQPAPTRVVMVSPLLRAQNRMLAAAGLLGMLGVPGTQVEVQGPSVGRWFKNRPTGTLKSLVDLGEVLQKQLAAGIALPEGAKVLLIQSDQDPTVDPTSAASFASGLKGQVSLRWVASKAHIPIWPDGVAEGVALEAHARLRAELLVAIEAALRP